MPLLSACAKSLVSCILSETRVLVTVTNVWNSKGYDKECPDRVLCGGLSISRDMCDLDLYFGYVG